MKSRGLHLLLVFVSLIAAIGLACATISPKATEVPASPKPPPVRATEAPAATQGPAATEAPAATSSGSGLTTFTDRNNNYEIDVPSDWKHTTSSGDNYYWDTFTSPDEGAVIENYTYDDGTPWTGKDSGKYALAVLNQLYSNSGKEGDIRVTEEKLQQDGSDRLTWVSKAGGYSGISFFEIRNETTFLMFTVDWGNKYEDQYHDTLNNVISSYRVP